MPVVVHQAVLTVETDMFGVRSARLECKCDTAVTKRLIHSYM